MFLAELSVTSSSLYATLQDDTYRLLESKYQSMFRNIPEQRRTQPYAASVEENLWRFNIEGLHVKYW